MINITFGNSAVQKQPDTGVLWIANCYCLLELVLLMAFVVVYISMASASVYHQYASTDLSASRCLLYSAQLGTDRSRRTHSG